MKFQHFALKCWLCCAKTIPSYPRTLVGWRRDHSFSKRPSTDILRQNLRPTNLIFFWDLWWRSASRRESCVPGTPIPDLHSSRRAAAESNRSWTTGDWQGCIEGILVHRWTWQRWPHQVRPGRSNQRPVASAKSYTQWIIMQTLMNAPDGMMESLDGQWS